MSYYLRIALVSAGVALLTAGLLWLGPRGAPVTLAAQAPNGPEVAVGAPIRVTFSRPVDRRSAEELFSLSPPAPGRFFWQDQTLTFQPSQPLAPNTEYQVTIAAGLRDEQGRANAADLSWRFTTRGPRLLVLRAADDGGSELWLVAPDGGARQLLAAPDGISEVVVAPDGTRAVYVEPRGVERNALMLIDLEGGATRPLVDDPQASAAAPAWAPTGDFIAYERRALTSGSLGVPRIWLAQPDGTLLGPLFTGDGSDISYAPAWAPDGNSLAFLDGVSQEVKVYSFFTDRVAALPARSGERVSWLPDGSAVVFSSAESGPSGLTLRLRAAGLAGGPARDLTDGAAAELTPAVAPDGASVAFTRRAPGEPASSIWVAPLGGGAPRRLSAAGPHQDTQPLWSPDGALVAFVRTSAGGPLRSEAVVVDAAGGAERSLLAGAVQIVWAP